MSNKIPAMTKVIQMNLDLGVLWQSKMGAIDGVIQMKVHL